MTLVYPTALGNDRAQRIEFIRAQREAGYTLADIGALLGVSRERIRQICQREGIAGASAVEVRVNPRAVVLASSGIMQVAAALGVASRKAYTILRGEGITSAAVARLYHWRVTSAARRRTIATVRAEVERLGRTPTIPELARAMGRHLNKAGISARGLGFANLGAMWAAAGVPSRKRGGAGHLGPSRPRARRAQCRRGHERTPDNLYAGRSCKQCVRIRTEARRCAR